MTLSSPSAEETDGDALSTDGPETRPRVLQIDIPLDFFKIIFLVHENIEEDKSSTGVGGCAQSLRTHYVSHVAG